MQEIVMSKESIDAAQAFLEIHEKGGVFAEDKSVRRTCEVYLAANRLADSLGGDIATHLGQKSGRTSYEILHNLAFLIYVYLGGGCFGVGAYDFGRKASYYYGVRCGGYTP